ncbi:protein-glutamate O-methyltransferase CheR, partial [Myxococcaceae bacterium JPH2]|nr:protein-glutamate O-methyltransferase CheR [Myxococcaceae bacterium JPH2]
MTTSSRPHVFPGAPEPRPLNDEEFQRFRAWVHQESGILLAETKKAFLTARLGHRIRALGLPSFGAYYQRVTSGEDADEARRMLEALCIHETSFFREPSQFTFLQDTLVPAWRAEAEHGQRTARLRIWSAACATGEEPYSVAMMLGVCLPTEEGWAVDLLATDLSTSALRRAREGLWPIERAREIPDAYLRRYMLKGTGKQAGWMKPGPQLRSRVLFRPLNLHHVPHDVNGTFDLILCRNVLMYFSPAARLRVVEGLTDRLRPGGHLFIGHAESLQGMSARLRCLRPTIYMRVAEAGT